MHCATDVETFERQTEKARWDGLIDASGVPSIHLSWDAVCAALASTRFVRAAWWLDGEGVLVGLAICEDSEAISQGIDDFLEGTALFGWAKSFLHRQGGFRFGVRAIGTPLASGPHGYRFVEGLDALPLLEPLFDMPGADGGTPPKTRVIKDRSSVQGWADGVRLSGQSSWKAGWVDLEFDPVMRVDLAGKPTWDAYLSAMRTKARTKVKRILSLSSSLDIVALDQVGIESQAAKLHELYMLVYGRAAFRLGCLMPDDLIQLKRHMRDRFQVWECRLDGALVGFFCGMCDGREVEAFFVGFKPEYNKTHALYQRMLLEFVQWGIREGCSVVHLGRTALDIKASLGAEPTRLVIHQRSASPVWRRLARWAARASAPKQEALKRAWKEEPSACVSGKPASVHHEVVSP